MKFDDLTGKRFGHWTVISRSENVGNHTMYKCLCDCGKIKSVYAVHLKSGASPSCGCITRGKIGNLNLTHGKSKTRLYEIYCGMKHRCNNENSHNFRIYGGRNISICEEWKNDFMSFYNWSIQNGYNESLTIDRIDVNGNYCPQNCRWATNKQQSNNTRRTIIVEYNGQKYSIKQLSEHLNVNYSKLYRGIQKKKMKIEDAIEYAKTYKSRKVE